MHQPDSDTDTVAYLNASLLCCVAVSLQNMPLIHPTCHRTIQRSAAGGDSRFIQFWARRFSRITTVAHWTVERPVLAALLQLSPPMTPAAVEAQNTNFSSSRGDPALDLRALSYKADKAQTYAPPRSVHKNNEAECPAAPSCLSSKFLRSLTRRVGFFFIIQHAPLSFRALWTAHHHALPLQQPHRFIETDCLSEWKCPCCTLTLSSGYSDLLGLFHLYTIVTVQQKRLLVLLLCMIVRAAYTLESQHLSSVSDKGALLSAMQTIHQELKAVWLS